jgi:hypothetical protein
VTAGDPGDGILGPVNPAEFAGACAAALTILVLPGFAAASLVVPGWKWWERLALSPGLSTGIVGLSGLVLHDLGLPFTPAIVLPLLAGIVLAGAADQWRRRGWPWRGGRPRAPSASWESLTTPAAIVAGLATAGIFVFSMRHQPLPIYDDPAVHAEVAEAIQRSHDVLPIIPNPVSHSSFVRPQSAIEATAAMAGWMAHLPPTQLLMPMGIVAAVLVFLGLVQLAEQWTSSRAVVLATPLLALGMAFPTLPLLFGEYPLLVDSTLVPGVIVASLRLMRGQDPLRTGLLVLIATASIWAGHGLEALTAATVGIALVVRELARPQGSRSRPSAAAGLVVFLLCVAAGAALVTFLTQVPRLPAVVGSAPAGIPLRTATLTPTGPQPDSLGTLLSTMLLALPSAPMVILLVAGCIYAFVRARLVGLVLTSVALVLAYYDVAGELRLGVLWRKVYPWGVTDRVVGMQYWVLPIILALGTVWLMNRAGQWLALGQASTARRVTASVMFALPVAVALWGGSVALAADLTDLTNRASGLGKVTQADLSVLQAMRQKLRAGAVVLTDGEDDAGIWLNALTPQVAFENKDWVNYFPDDPHLVALQNACDQPQEATRALSQVDAVFVGSRRQSIATHPWRLDCISHLPGLVLVASAGSGDGTAAVFAVSRNSR